VKKNILLVGSNSFVGSNIKKYLIKRKNFNIHSFLEKFEESDILNLSNKHFSDKYFCKILKKIDYIIYLVHINSINIKDETLINIKLVEKILHFQLLHKSHLIYFSSVNSNSSSNKNKYSLVKKNIENYIKKKFNSFLILRLSTIIKEKKNQIVGGKNGKSLLFINFLIKKIKFFPILGNGQFIHTVLHIEDLCKFLDLHLKKRIFRNITINLFNGQYLTYKEFIQYISKYLKKKIYLIYLPIFFVKSFIKVLNFIYLRKITIQMLNNVLCQKIEYDYTNKILKFLKFKKVIL